MSMEDTAESTDTAELSVTQVPQKPEEKGNKPLLLELWDFLRVRKMWWLLPIIIMLLLVAALIVLSQSSAVSPFVYALF